MRWRLPAGAAVMVLLVVGVVVTVAMSGSGDRLAGARTPVYAGPSAPRPQLTLSVAADGGARAIPAGFLGLSIEFQAVRTYTGSDPSHVNPVLVQLIRNLSPGQAPVLRIGGDSTDASFAPAPSVKAPSYIAYELSPSWMATTAALAHELGAQMIMGVNLGADQPALATAEASDYVQALGRNAILAFEIGNEPNLYGKIRLFRTPQGASFRTRPRRYDYARFRSEFGVIASVIPPLALAGPALAVGPTPDKGSWARSMPDLFAAQPRLGTLTVHRYPLRNCFVAPGSVQYPTVAHLLSNYATATLAAGLRSWIGLAHAHSRRIRIDELNSVACRGKHGVSDTFAASLWAADALFSLASAGVDGVNLHTLPNSAYELFRFSRSGGRWHGHVQPVYYGLQLFAQAAPRGSRLLKVMRSKSSPQLSAWATRAPDGRVRMVLINKSPSAATTVAVRPPAATASSASAEWLRAPSVSSRRGVTLGGRGYGTETSTGRLAAPRTQALAATRGGAYVVSVPRGSAALVTFAP
jgi:hypothetical protein